jgi:TonB family protein
MKNRHLCPALAALGGVLALGAGGATPAETEAPDAPLKIIRTQPIIFPWRMINEGVTQGEARLAFHIDADGRLVDWLVVAYSARPFADSAVDALRQWKFVPERSGGQPGASIVHLAIRFETSGTIAIERTQPSDMDGIRGAPAGTFIFQPCPPTALDQPLRPIAPVAPDYPGVLRRQGVGGNVTVVFYVDEKGKPRMVASTGEAHPTLAALAIAAVEQWRFEPPRSRGRPVLVNVSQEFRFSATDT